MRQELSAESVRIVHANGQPNSYTLNQVYIPNDPAHREKGIFFILVTDHSTRNGEFVSSLSTTLIRDYFRHGAAQGIDGFEHALFRVNEQIRANNPTPTHLQGVICLLFKNEIHLSYIGGPQAILLRHNEPMNLAEDSDKANQDSPAFSVITSGEVNQSDSLALIVNLTQMSVHQSGESLQFSLTQQPLSESGRALARIFKDTGNGAAEAILLSLTLENPTSHSIAIDKSLETNQERLHRIQTKVAGVVATLSPHAKRFLDTSKRLYQTKLYKSESNPAETSQNSEPKELHKPAPRLDGVREDVKQEPPIDYFVKSYKQATKHQQDHPPTNEATPEQAEQPYRPFRLAFLKTIKPRTLYFLFGVVAVLIIAITLFNRLSAPPKVNQTAQERDALVEKATALAREADAASAEDNTAKAIEKLIETQNLLKELDPKLSNEKSKALTKRSTELIAKLTNTNTLTSSSPPVTLTTLPLRILATPSTRFIFSQPNSVIAEANSTLSPIEFPNPTILDATFFNQQKNIAILTENNGTNQLWNLDTTTKSITEIKRSDTKPWPKAHHVASFDTNLYLIGDTITKAITSGSNYRVVAVKDTESTKNITSLIANGSSLFGLDSNRLITRITTSAPRTPIRLFGLPESFWPQGYSRIISSQIDGQLYLFDRESQRVTVVTSDGGYKKQFVLNSSTKLIDCDYTTTAFVCATDDKTILTFPTP